jgi:hypothetical protein
MPTIRIDKFTTLPAPIELHNSKHYWELFPYDAEIDMADWTYGGQPMSEDQISFIEAYRIEIVDTLDYDEELSKRILMRTEGRLNADLILIDPDYKDLLNRMAMVMSASSSMKCPMVITTRPGLGKTQMLKASIIEKLKADGEDNHYSAIVVTKRVQDGLAISKEVNDELGTDSCWVRPSFTLMTLDGLKCANGHIAEDHHPTICRRANCAQRECPVKSWRRDYKKHDVVFITSEYFQHLIDNDSLKDLMETGELNLDEIDPGLHYLYDSYNQSSEGFLTFYRSELIIDENPGMIFHPTIKNRMLNDCMAHLISNSFTEEIIQEYTSIMIYITWKIPGALEYEYVKPQDKIPAFSNQFKKAWEANPHPDYHNMPLILDGFVKNGGIRQKGNKYIEYAIGTSKYRNLKGLPFRIVILDGSGLKDLTYKSGDFFILDVPEIRDHSRAHIHVYPKNLSKSFYRGKLREIKIKSVAEEAIRVLGDKPSLFITYKDLKSKFSELLKEHPNILVDHFGNLIGRNEYSKCTAVFFAGTNDWGTFEYFTQASAVSMKALDLTTVQHRGIRFQDASVGEFYSALMAVGMYQDLMRSNLRVTSDTDQVDIYIWSAAREVVQQIVDLLPKVNEPIYVQIPEILVGKRQPKEISTTNLRILDYYKSNLTDEDFKQTLKPKSIGLTKALGEVPLQAEYEYVWGPIKHGHYPRIKVQSNKWLANNPK